MKTLLALALTTASALAQGPLIPPAAPAPSMKTLAQIEARTPIPASPAVPIAGPHFTITAPGSYYLTGNIQVASGDGILINSSNVTLDLNGFALISTAVVNPSSGSAILLGLSTGNIHIRNGNILGGTIRTAGGPATYSTLGWYSGILDQSAVLSENVQISQINVKACRYGIYLLGKDNVISHCSARSNSASGILAEEGNIINSTANLNGGVGIIAIRGSVTSSSCDSNASDGMDVTNGSVSNCTADTNGGVGIIASGGSVINSTVYQNGGRGISVNKGSITNCSANVNGSDGIGADGSSITNCSANFNGQDGIDALGSVLSDCRASSNNANPDPYTGLGIRWTGGKIHNSLADTATPAIP